MEIVLSREHLNVVDNWFHAVDRTAEIPKIDEIAFDILFDKLGAKREISDNATSSLHAYSNKQSRLGMEAVWGRKRYKNFIKFCELWIGEYEKSTGITLPALTESGKKDAGMKEFFHELTVYMYGLESWDDFAERSQVRLVNGRLWQDGKKNARLKIDTPISDGKDKLIGSMPPGFISDFWDWLRESNP